jgi:hypothetical protein
MYKIRGRHSTVYPVQLPNWSCPDVVKKLIRRFDNYLRGELLKMWTEHQSNQSKEQLNFVLAELKRKSGHSNHPSLQSVSSAITVLTDTSTFSTGTDLNDLNSRTDELPSYLPEADDHASQ